jgi:hypothetical protein
MPISICGEVATNSTTETLGNISSITPNVTIVATPWYTTIAAATLGALIGGIITFAITYAKARAEMKWSFKQDAVTAIINELDQSAPRTPRTNQEIHRRVRHLIHVAFKSNEIRTVANGIVNQRGMELAELQRRIDNELIPLVETDLEETMNNWWKPWKW